MKNWMKVIVVSLLAASMLVSCGKTGVDNVPAGTGTDSGTSWTSVASVPNENGEIGSNPGAAGAADEWGGDVEAAYERGEAADTVAATTYVARTTTTAATYHMMTTTWGGGAWDADAPTPALKDGFWDEDMPGYYFPEYNYHAGMLTASEWNDLDNWEDWLTLIRDNNWYSRCERWHVLTQNKIDVTVQNGGRPVANAAVALCAGNGQTLFLARTDIHGVAHVFYDMTEKDKAPAYVQVSLNGVTAQAEVNGNSALTVELDAESPATKLDLMFMVDTTGSMGDELEFLKEELADVVNRVGKQTGVPLRTSVNFYRDEGDEYVVRYFRFEENVDEAVSYIRAQRADGGGDEPEAVHTAMDNAVNGHAWDEDSVKLLVLVLDAPPHDEEDVRASLEASMNRAAELGIRVIPVICSNANDLLELLGRSWAVLTGGTYVYLTNDSGYGGYHAEQHIEDSPETELLNDLLVRVISDYCK